MALLSVESVVCLSGRLVDRCGRTGGGGERRRKGGGVENALLWYCNHGEPPSHPRYGGMHSTRCQFHSFSTALTCSSTHPDTGLCARLDLGFCLLLLGVFSSLGSARLQTHICSDEPHPGLTACDDGHKGYFVRRGGTRSGVQEC